MKIKSLLGATFVLLAIAGLFLLGATHSRTPPESLNVFVLINTHPPKEFYSSPHAYQLLQQGQGLATLSLGKARALGIPMAEESKQDFMCWHNTITWWLIDEGWWGNDCRWTNEGQWQ